MATLNMDASGKPPAYNTGGDAPMPEAENQSPASDSDMPNTFEVPLDSFGGKPPMEGASFRAKIVSVDQDSGTVTAEVMQAPKRGRGIQEAAGEFGASAPGM